MTGQAIAGEQGDDGEGAKRQFLSAVAKLKQKPDVKQILKDINVVESFKLPQNRRQRRSLNNRGKNDVSEVYSPKRISKVAGEIRLPEGWAVDLTEFDPGVVPYPPSVALRPILFCLGFLICVCSRVLSPNGFECHSRAQHFQPELLSLGWIP